MVNEYVSFVSDREFLECVRWVVDEYSKEIDYQKNIIDPFKAIIDISSGQISYDEWLRNEKNRQKDKSINNKIGEFHQKLLGKVSNWEDLGVGDDTKVDLKKSDNSIFIELKNKHNTVNGDSKKKCRDKLEDLYNQYSDAQFYFAFIVPKNGKSEIKNWKVNGSQVPEDKIKIISGKKVYELITGDGNNLNLVLDALPKAIKEILGHNNNISNVNLEKTKELFQYAFRKS